MSKVEQGAVSGEQLGRSRSYLVVNTRAYPISARRTVPKFGSVLKARDAVAEMTSGTRAQADPRRHAGDVAVAPPPRKWDDHVPPLPCTAGRFPCASRDFLVHLTDSAEPLAPYERISYD